MTNIPRISGSSSARYQFLATIIVNLTNILYGYAAGWTSSSFLTLESPTESPLAQGALDQDERSWVTSLFAISGVMGTLFYYITSDYFGCKYSLLSAALPHAISWALIEVGNEPWHLYASRVLSGLGSGGGFVVVPIFVAEISESHVRGRLGSLLMLSANAGFLFAFIAGHYLSYHQIPFLGILISIVFIAAFVFFPDTPAHYLRRDDQESAEKSFRFYRNVESDAVLDERLKAEWEMMRTQHASSAASTQDKSVDWTVLYKTKSGRKALLIGLVMVCMHELCGCFTMLNYTATIFRESGSSISPKLSAIAVGAIQLLGTYVASFLVDRLGRKILLVGSAVGTAICLLCLGSYSYANSAGVDVKPYSWVSIASFSGMMFLAACGIIPLMFVVISEVMPEKIRGIGCTVCFCLSWILAFVMVKFFESVAEVFGMHGWVFFFAACTLVGTAFIIVLIPETKGKTYAEIAVILER